MPDFNAPLGDCIKPPCFTFGQVLEGTGYLLAALVVLVIVLVFFTRVLGGRLAPAAPEYASPSGAYGLSGWMLAALERLPRPWRDETFYEQLRADQTTFLKAAATVAVTALVVVAPAVFRDSSAGGGPEGIQQMIVATMAALGIWLFLAAVAVLMARVLFRRRPRLPVVLAGLGFAASPLILLALAFLPVLGILVALVGLSWSLVLCYVAIRGTVGSDEMQALGITVSMALATFVTWMVVQLAFVRPAPGPSVVCDGLVDSSGVCIPMEQVPPSVQTAIAVPQPR